MCFRTDAFKVDFDILFRPDFGVKVTVFGLPSEEIGLSVIAPIPGTADRVLDRR